MDIVLSILIIIVGAAGGAAVAFLFGRFGKSTEERRNSEFKDKEN